MTITLYEFFIVLIVHWFADFILQTNWQALNKSSSNEALTSHVSTYSVCWLLPMFLLFWIGPFNLFGGVALAIVFSSITFLTHWITDYYTSRLNAKLWKKGDTHNFFVSVGFDQILHYTQLFLTYLLLKNI